MVQKVPCKNNANLPGLLYKVLAACQLSGASNSAGKLRLRQFCISVPLTELHRGGIWTYSQHSGFWLDFSAGLHVLLIFIHCFNLLVLLYFWAPCRMQICSNESQELAAGAMKANLVRALCSALCTMLSRSSMDTSQDPPTCLRFAATQKESHPFRQVSFPVEWQV